MICALTVRRLKPGTFEDFRAAFLEGMLEEIPENWLRFNMIRNVEDPDEVITFGFFSGTVDELRAAAADEGEYERQLERIAPYVESVGADGLFEVVEDRAA